MELLEYYDEKNEELIGIEERDYIHKNNLWHREVAVWVRNEKNQVLIQRRSSNKKQAPNKLSITAGHVDVNEEVQDAAIREVREEIGLEINKEDLIFLDVYKNEQFENMCYQYTYLVKTNCKIEEFTIQEDEVSELMYMGIEELEERVRIQDMEFGFVKKPHIKLVLQKIKEMC